MNRREIIKIPDIAGQVFNEERIVGIVGEVIAWAKDDRLNTKRAISSDTASRAMVQKQNGQLMNVCDPEEFHSLFRLQ